MLNSVPSLSLLRYSFLDGLAADGVVGLISGGTGGRCLRREGEDLDTGFWVL